MATNYTYRDGRDDDADALIALLGSCFSEYENCILDVDGEIPELRAIATAFAAWGGAFRVAERDGRVVACIGFTAEEGDLFELKKLYVYASERGAAGPAHPLLRWLEETIRARATAANRGATVELWSDTRFVRAHRFYEKLGYEKTGKSRELFDQSATIEFHFRKRLVAGSDEGAPPAK